MPALSFLIPTAGRPELECALASIAPQLEPGDEVIVIGDTTDSPLPASQAITASFGPQFRWIELAGEEHSWGHAQLNLGITQAQGDYIHCSDDDDIWALGAANVMRRAASAAPGRPILFRFLSWHGLIFWDRQGMLAQDHIGGHCLLAQNKPGLVGEWGLTYQGDYSYVLSTITLQGGISNVVWRDELVAIARPSGVIRQQVLEKVGRGLVPQ